MNGYVQTGIGIAVSILLFWLSYRQTIGAKKERTKNANKSVHRAIMRRMVLEDYSPIYKDVSRIIEGKAREFNTSANDMLSEEQILNSIYTEIFDSDLISPVQRVEIEKRLAKIFETDEEKASIPTIQEFKLLKEENKSKRDSLAWLTVTVSSVGATTSLLYSYIKDPASIIASNKEWLFSGLGVFVVSLAMITLMSLIKKQKEDAGSSSKRSSALSAATFEIEVAKGIEKAGYKYTSDPKIGKYRPDFIIETNGKHIAIETKAWDEVVPLNIIRRTLHRLEALSSEEGIDGVLLVTRKPTPIRGFNSEEKSVRIVSMSDFISMLKNKRVA